MTSFVQFLHRIYLANYPPSKTDPASKPIKFGILGAAWIAPLGIILPARSHPEVEVWAVAARDERKAANYARKHGIRKVYGGPKGYQDLLDDPEIDAVYNPLPNGLHYEWTMKALAAGKHVLLEKPSSNTAEETRKLLEFAEEKGLVLLEAFHYRFHPCSQRIKAIIDSGELGAIKHIEIKLTFPDGVLKDDDIRFDYGLGGGALMDLGCYAINFMRYVSSANTATVTSARHDLHTPSSAPPSFTPNVDFATVTTLALPNDATAAITLNLGKPRKLIMPALPQIYGKIECEGGELEIFNFLMPTLYHYITIRKREGNERKTRVEKVYTFQDGKMDGPGEAWWTTYRFQLEAFVNRLKGRTPQTWISKEDSIANMEFIENVYAKSGLGSRPRSGFVMTAKP